MFQDESHAYTGAGRQLLCLLGVQYRSVFGSTYVLYSVFACVVQQGCTPSEESNLMNDHAPVASCQRL